MREVMLTVHFTGLAMGLGTSLGFMFLGIAASKMGKEEGLKFTLNSFALSRMGQIGLVLLVLSGGYLMTPYWKNLGNMPLMIAKLTLVLVLGALIGIISAAGRKARQGDAETHLKKVPTLGRFSLLTALAIVVLAVLIFR
ncbi:MAG TPA: hypothetical protein PKE06_09620 [Flavilitoribacter sp.]|nr:hypothetical protein [Flavilitoribacter sp.]HMQ91365.1 hypothetical protein [Flavilitoribacter sp.]